MEKPRVTPAQRETLERFVELTTNPLAFVRPEEMRHILAEQARERAIAFCPDCAVPVWLTRMADYGVMNQDAGVYSAAFTIAGILGGDGWLECETCFGK